MSHDYLLCGWRVSSAFALPELVAWPGPAEAPVDIHIVSGSLPDRLGSDATSDLALSVDATGTVLLHIKDCVRILVERGHTIVIDRLQSESKTGWRLFLLGSAIGYLCLQRGLFPLHAACLRIGGKTVALAGHSGSGKSTLAAALSRHGHGLLSDDLTVLRCTAAGAVEVLPSFPRLKLWRQTLDALEIATTGLAPVRDGLDKYDVSPLIPFAPATVPLDAVLVLGEAEAPSLRRCLATEAVPILHGFLSRPRAAAQLGLLATTFAQAATISRCVPVWHLHRAMRFDALNATADLIEAQFGA